MKAEEPPSALLLAHAALLSARKHARRRAALWYLFAANRLEKCGFVSGHFLCPDNKSHWLAETSYNVLSSESSWIVSIQTIEYSFAIFLGIRGEECRCPQWIRPYHAWD